MGPDDSLTPDGEVLEPGLGTVARRRAIAAQLVGLGFISEQSAERDNPAIEVLAALLPQDSEIGVCLSCHGFECSGMYAFRESRGLFRRITEHLTTSPYGFFRSRPSSRRELVVCTADALSWTHSQPRLRGERVIGDDVVLYSVPFADVVGAAVQDRHKGVIDVWIYEGPTLSFKVTPLELDSLCSYIERAATSE